MTSAPRFAVDRMLGRLARWLRLLGFDAICRPDLPGPRLMTLAAREGRIVVTRDRRLARARSAPRVVVVASSRFREQLRELDREVPLGAHEERAPRCAACNLVVEPVALDRLPATVPADARAAGSGFLRCPGCARIDWPASRDRRLAGEIAGLGLSPPRAIDPGAEGIGMLAAGGAP